MLRSSMTSTTMYVFTSQEINMTCSTHLKNQISWLILKQTWHWNAWGLLMEKSILMEAIRSIAAISTMIEKIISSIPHNNDIDEPMNRTINEQPKSLKLPSRLSPTF